MVELCTNFEYGSISDSINKATYGGGGDANTIVTHPKLNASGFYVVLRLF